LLGEGVEDLDPAAAVGAFGEHALIETRLDPN
jgi:hypothetical protein